MHLISLFFCLLLFACATSQTGSTAQPDRPLNMSMFSKEDSLDYPKAEAFDRFLRRVMNQDEETTLRSSCQKKDNDNIFCYAVNNFDRFERQMKAREYHVPGEKKIPPAVVAVFSKQGKPTNWGALRNADVPNLLRGLLTATPVELNRLKAKAIRERRCPNNIAVAIAATLEDNLPNNVSTEDIAKLDEKGGNCAKTGADQEAFYARAGLFYFAKKKYRPALSLFERGADAKTFVGRSLYWLYRTQLELGDKKNAAETLDEIKGRYPFSFHTVAAMIASGSDPGEILSRPDVISQKRSKQSNHLNQLISELEALRRFNFEQSADRVLDYAILNSQNAEPEVKIYLGELKKDNTDHSAKLQMISDVLFKNSDLVSRTTLELYFPKLFATSFERNPASVDPYLLMAVARQESLFNPKAISPANAYGLMQIQPATGKRFGVANGTDLADPSVNIQAGSKYIAELLNNVSGQVERALAAYNAGTDRLSTWVTRYPNLEPILFIDLIPYRETRDYVASVLRNYYWYRRLYAPSPLTSMPKIFDFQSPHS
jgi:soluble lytic murein transglycosylase